MIAFYFLALLGMVVFAKGAMKRAGLILPLASLGGCIVMISTM